MFQRLEILIGNDNLNKIKSKNVLVIGCGGVGSYVVEVLVRSGIHNINVVDFDTIDISNLNRQLMTNIHNIGFKKVDEIKKRVLDINSDINFTGLDIYVDEHNLLDILNNNYDYVVDACDTVSIKKQLIIECLNRKIKLISSMGTARKLDPSRLKITDIRNTINDPLARIIRKFVKDNNIKEKVMVVSSDEMPIKIDSEVLGSTAFVPSTAGILCASYIINDIIKN